MYTYFDASYELIELMVRLLLSEMILPEITGLNDFQVKCIIIFEATLKGKHMFIPSIARVPGSRILEGKEALST